MVDLPLAWWAICQAWLHLCVAVHSLLHRVEEAAEDDEDLVYHTFNETLYYGPVGFASHVVEEGSHAVAFIMGMMG